VRDEIVADAKKYGDDRRTQLVERAAAQAIDETELVASEPVTVVLSRSGWARAAKGHEIDPARCRTRPATSFRAAAKGAARSRPCSSTARVARTACPRTRCRRPRAGRAAVGSSRPPDGATFAGVLIGEPYERCVLASAAGYGFVVKLGELHSRATRGQGGAQGPGRLERDRAGTGAGCERCVLAAVNSDGRLLTFPVATCRSSRAARATRSSVYRRRRRDG
jgi:topoisomerase-4 subunit A